jgi:HlyD family secretion protein
VLQVTAKVGELAAPAWPQPLMSLGDLSALRVRAELDELDVGKIKLGDNVVFRADVFGVREFAGKVANIAPIIRPGRINSSESRNPTDFSVMEVLIGHWRQ